MARKIGTETIVVIRAAKVDRLSTAAPTTPPEHNEPGFALIPTSVFEEGQGWVTKDEYDAWGPYDADILHTDQIRLPDATVWEVAGTVQRFKTRRGQEKACRVHLKRLGAA